MLSLSRAASLCLVSFMVFFMVLSSPAAGYEWREYGPPGGSVRDMVSDFTGAIHVIATGNTPHRSWDGGKTWDRMPGLPGDESAIGAVICGATDGVLLVLTNYEGVMRWDEVLGWSEANNGIDRPAAPYAWEFFDIAVADATSTRVFLGCSTGFYYSDDYGDVWQKVAVANYTSQTFVAGTDGSVYFEGRNGVYPPFRLEPNLVDRTLFYGKNGIPSTRQIYGKISPDPLNSDRLIFYEYNYAKAFYSEDRGENWTDSSLGEPPSDMVSVGWLQDRPIVIGNRSVFSLEPSTGTWTKRWTRNGIDTYGVIAVHPDEAALLLWGARSSVWRSEDDGETWKYSCDGMSSFGSVRDVAVAETNPRVVYLGMGSGGVYRTKDDGKSWDIVNDGLTVDPAYSITVRSLEVNPTNGQHVLVGLEETGGKGGFYSTTNGGMSWTKIEWDATSPVNDIHFVKSQANTILAALIGQGIWRSTNNGSSWTQVAKLPQVNNAICFAETAGGRIYCGVVGGFDYTNNYFYSDNAGQTWNEGSGAPLVKSLAADPSDANKIMAGSGWWGSGSGIYLTENNGTEWSLVNTGLPQTYSGYPEADSLIGIPGQSGTYLVSMGRDIYQTLNYGTQWTNAADIGVFDSTRLLYSSRNQGTVFAGSSAQGLWYTQLVEPLPTFTPTKTPTATITPTPTNTSRIPPSPTMTPTSPAAVNVGLADDTFHISPVSPAVGDSVTVGVRLFNNGTVDQSNVKVSFYYRTDGGAWTLLHGKTVSSVPARSWANVNSSIALSVSSEGNYYLKAVVDEAGQIAETDETDNLVNTSFYARVKGSDTSAPTGGITVAGGSLFSPNIEVSLDLKASDTGTGVQWMYVTAWAYSPWTYDFFPYYVSDWLPYDSHAWFYLLGFDLEAISVNYADLDGNISRTYWGYINYAPTDLDYVWYDWMNWHTYRLTQGSQVTITMPVTWGDADLFVVAPSTPEGQVYLASQNDGSVSENLSFTVPETGLYYVGVFGYLDAEYRLLCSSSSGVVARAVKADAVAMLAEGRRTPDFTNKPSDIALPNQVRVPSVASDLNGDGIVDYRDVLTIMEMWGTQPGESGYDARVGSIRPNDPIGPPHLQQWMRLKK